MKKEILELKHLIDYLPFGILVTKEDWGYYFQMSINHNVLYNMDISEVLRLQGKPILRPLSDFTKEIIINGKKIIPRDELEEMNLYDDIQWILCNDLSECKFLTIKKLCEWHFDIYFLIPKGLALNINNLESNE